MTQPQPRRDRRAAWAALVIQHISHNHWVSGVELQQLTNLRYQQVIDGIAYLRDHHPDYPLISKPFRGYIFSVDPQAVREFQKWRVSTSYTIMRRAYYGAIDPWLESLPVSQQRTSARRNFGRALEDLGDLITLNL